MALKVVQREGLNITVIHNKETFCQKWEAAIKRIFNSKTFLVAARLKLKENGRKTHSVLLTFFFFTLY